jgi:hypothetical protein
VKYEIQKIDAAFIEANTGQSVYDCCLPGIDYRQINGAASKPAGDLVCQMGYNSRVVCDLLVYNTFYTYQANGTIVEAVAAIQGYSLQAAQGGDSGGSVISINDPNSRQVNGIVSGRGLCTDGDWCILIYIDVMRTFNDFAIRLHS